jgi:hypothetical protein
MLTSEDQSVLTGAGHTDQLLRRRHPYFKATMVLSAV